MYHVWELSLGVSLVEDPKSWTFYWHLHSFQLSENQEYILDSNLILLRFETSNFPRCPLSYGDVTSSHGTYSGRTWSLERRGCTCMLLIDQSKGVRTDVGHTHSSCVFSSSRMCVLLNWLWELECCDDLCNRVALCLSLSLCGCHCVFVWLTQLSSVFVQVLSHIVRTVCHVPDPVFFVFVFPWTSTRKPSAAFWRWVEAEILIFRILWTDWWVRRCSNKLLIFWTVSRT